MSIHPHDFSVSPESPTDPPKIFTPTPFKAELEHLPIPPIPPFIRIGNFCIAVDRIVSVEYLQNGVVYLIGDNVYYGESNAENAAKIFEKPFEERKAQIITINFVSANSVRDYIRRWGDEAQEAWTNICGQLT